MHPLQGLDHHGLVGVVVGEMDHEGICNQHGRCSCQNSRVVREVGEGWVQLGQLEGQVLEQDGIDAQGQLVGVQDLELVACLVELLSGWGLELM